MRTWPDPLLYWPVILLEHVVQVFARIAPVRGAEIAEVLRHKKEGHKTREDTKRGTGPKGGTGQIVGHCIPLASSAFKP